MAANHGAQVVVVGAGPVGLLAALALKKAGADVQVYDSGRRTAAHSYALVLHAATLEAFDAFGLTASCLAAGRIVTGLGVFDGAARKGQIDFAGLGSPHPYVVVLPQSRLETILEDALERQGVKVHWDHRAQAFETSADGVRLTIAKLDKVSTGYPIAHTEVVVDKTFDVDAACVVGADGYDSFVRRRLGIPWNDMGPGQLHSVFQFEPSGDIPAEGRLMLEPGRVGGYWPLPDGRCRFSFPIEAESEHRPDTTRLAELLARRAPWFTAKAGAIEWTALGLFERKLAGSFGAGRVWLAGDAGHLTGPLGAQSMNVGLLEAADLARRIGAVIRDGAGQDVLDGYGAARLAEWRTLFGAGREAGVASLLLPCLPASGKRLDSLLGQLAP